MNLRRRRGSRPLSDVELFVAVLVAITVASLLADGVTRLVLIVAVAAVIGVLVRLFALDRHGSRGHRSP